MSDKHKPKLSFLIKRPGRKQAKLELFAAQDFGQRHLLWGKKTAPRYRLRVNGKWFGSKGKAKLISIFTWWQVRDLLWRSIGKP